MTVVQIGEDCGIVYHYYFLVTPDEIPRLVKEYEGIELLKDFGNTMFIKVSKVGNVLWAEVPKNGEELDQLAKELKDKTEEVKQKNVQ